MMFRSVGNIFLWNCSILFFIKLYNCDSLTGLKITDIQIPKVVDYRDDLILGCSFVMGYRELYSVKWYKNDDEFYRFTPNSRTVINHFPITGVHLTDDTLAGKHCNLTYCAIHLTNLSLTQTNGWYKCEISTESPEFELAFNSTYLTVLGLLKKDPEIEGLSRTYQVNDYLTANCTAGPSDPSPVITWMINGKTAPAITTEQYSLSIPDPSSGFNYRRVSIRFLLKDYHFVNNKLSLKCVASLENINFDSDNIPGITRSTTQTILLHNQNFPWQSNQKFQWFGFSSGVANSSTFHLIYLALIILLIT